MSRPPYSMYLYARSARGPPYPIYLYAGSASRPPYPIYLYARYASRPPCPIYLCAGSAGRPPYPIYLYVGLLAIVIPEIGEPWLRCKDEDKSNVLINNKLERQDSTDHPLVNGPGSIWTVVEKYSRGEHDVTVELSHISNRVICMASEFSNATLMKFPYTAGQV